MTAAGRDDVARCALEDEASRGERAIDYAAVAAATLLCHLAAFGIIQSAVAGARCMARGCAEAGRRAPITTTMVYETRDVVGPKNARIVGGRRTRQRRCHGRQLHGGRARRRRMRAWLMVGLVVMGRATHGVGGKEDRPPAADDDFDTMEIAAGDKVGSRDMDGYASNLTTGSITAGCNGLPWTYASRVGEAAHPGPTMRGVQQRRLSLTTGNITGWGTGLDWLQTASSHIICLQEHKQRTEEEVAEASTQAKARGWKSFWTKALTAPTEPGGASAGVAVMTKSGVGALDPPGGHVVHEGRAVAALVEAGETGGVVVYSIYLVCGDEMGAENWRVLESVARHIAGHGLPWVCAGDWNVTPHVLAASGWPSRLNAKVVVPPVDHTTRAGGRAGRLLDYFVASRAVADVGLEVSVDARAPLKTHDAVRLLLPMTPRRFEVTRLLAAKAFPRDKPIGPRKEPRCAAELRQATTAVLGWAANDGGNGGDAMMNDATDWLLQMVEDELIQVYHLDEGGHEQEYRGRASGHKFIRAPVMGPKHRGHPRGDPAARRLRMMEDRATDLVGALRRASGKGRPTADLEERVRAAIDTATYVGSDEALPAECGEVAMALKRVARKLENAIKKRRNVDVDRWVNEGHFCELGDVVDRAAAAAEPAEARHRNAAARGVTEWCKNAQANGAGLAHRWTQVPTAWRPETAPTRCEVEVGVTTNPDAVVDQEASRWEPLWRPPHAADRPVRWGKVAELSRPTVKDVRRAARRFRANTKQGIENLSPRDMSELSDGLVEAYIDLMMACEKLGRIPDRVAVVVVMLLGKKLGGRRPVGILPTVYRLWAAVRKPLLHDWERTWSRAFFAAARGKSAADATWNRALRAEHAALVGASAGSILWDLRKCFEHGRHDILAAEAEALGFPMAMARLASAMYAAERRLNLDGAYSRAVKPTRGFVAGCAWAMACVKVTLLRRLDAFVLRHPSIAFELYVDDAEIQAVGQGKSVARDLAAAATDLADLLEKEAGYPLAHDKAVVVASEQRVAAEVIRLTDGKAGKLAAITEKLGIEYGAGKRRPRRGGPRRARIGKQMARKRRIAKLQRMSGAAARIVVSRGVLPAAMYDGLVNGISDAELYRLRGLMARATAPTARGSYTLLKLMLTEDPAVKANADVIARWAGAAWRAAGPVAQRKEGEPSAPILQGVMKAALEDMNASPDWGAARGPVGGLVRTARRIGWTVADAFKLTDENGRELDLGVVDPRAVREKVKTATEKASAKQIAAHERAPRLADGVWAAPIRSALRSRQLAPAARACLRRTFTGGYWTGARRAAAGLAPHAGCECGAPNDDVFHRIYECPRSQDARDKMLDHALLQKARNAPRGSLFWTRALARDPRTELPPATDAHDEQWFFADDVEDRAKVLTGDIYIDGSALFPTCAAARRAGWAAVNLKADGTVRVAVFGPVPVGVSPSQTAAAGELHALRRAAELACGEVRFLTDYQSAVNGNRRGPAATTGYRTASAAAWRGFWRATDGEAKEVLKVEAHRSAKSAREDENDADAVTKKLGNDAADTFAKRGAAAHHTASELALLEDYAAGEAELRGLALFIGTALANWPPAPRNTRADGEAKVRRREVARRRKQAAAAHGHRIRWGRNGWQCATCGMTSTTLAGRRRLMMTQCNGHTGARVQEQGADPAAHILWAAEADATDAGAAGADIVWCSRCGGYSSARLYKLGGRCPGTADPPARTRLARLNRRRHPTLGYGLGNPIRLTDGVIAQLRAAGERQRAGFAEALKGTADDQPVRPQRVHATSPTEEPTAGTSSGGAASSEGGGAADVDMNPAEAEQGWPEEEDVFGFGGGFDEEDGLHDHPRQSDAEHGAVRRDVGVSGHGDDNQGGDRACGLEGRTSERNPAERARARSEAARERIRAIGDRVKRRRVAEATKAGADDVGVTLNRIANGAAEASQAMQTDGEETAHGRNQRLAGCGRMEMPNIRRSQVEANCAAQNSAVVARVGPGGAELACATGTVAPLRAVATVPVAAREDATILQLGVSALVARPPDGAAAPSDDLRSGVAVPHGREDTTSHTMPVTESGGRPPSRSSYSPQGTRARRGAGPRAREELGDDEGDTPPQEKVRRRDGSNGTGSRHLVAHRGSVATRAAALKQPETGCGGYTTQSARQSGCMNRTPMESHGAIVSAEGAEQRMQGRSPGEPAHHGGGKKGDAGSSSAGGVGDEARGHHEGNVEHDQPEATDVGGRGRGEQRRAQGHYEERQPSDHSCGIGPGAGYGHEVPRDALAMSDVGSFGNMRRTSSQAARAALLEALARPRKRARSRSTSGGRANRRRCLAADRRHESKRDLDACWNATPGNCSGGEATCLASDSSGARRRLRGKQPPREGIG